MKVKKAVIPAAGVGTRFLPATKVVPKELLPIVDKPTIQYIVEEAVSAGIKDVILITGRGKGSIEQHFNPSVELERYLRKKGEKDLLRRVREITNRVKLIFVRQNEPLGLGHAILCAQKAVGKEPFAVLLGDDLIDAPIPCIRQMMDLYERLGGAIIAIKKVPRSETHLYGIIRGRKIEERTYRIEEMVEKPEKGKAPSTYAIIGRYVLPPEIFDLLEDVSPDHRGEIQLTNGLRELRKRASVFGYEFIGDRYDAGDKFGFLQANISYGLKHPEVGKKLTRCLKNIQL
ncbi:MAG: UTP--glucose-1-phosphate uridylyltransferase GalU [Thermodesulfobacteriota bacterium]